MQQSEKQLYAEKACNTNFNSFSLRQFVKPQQSHQGLEQLSLTINF